eukprot:8786537-Lingulodinium_polyedra.AAC.1
MSSYAVIPSLRSAEDKDFKHIFLFLSVFEHKGCMKDFGVRLMEEEALHPGSCGDASAFKT